MDNVLMMALAKQLKNDTKDLNVPVGLHNIDATITLHITGTLRKSADTTYMPTVDIPMLPTLALVLEKAGFQRERAKQILIESMTEALNANEQAGPVIAERVKDIETAMSHVREVTGQLPRKPKAGPTNVAIQIVTMEAEAD